MIPMTINRFSQESGYSEQGIRGKIKRRDWPEGLVWKRAPDGRILIDADGYRKWVEGEAERSAA